MRFSSPNPTFSACCGCCETFIPFGLRGRDSPMAWLRQYQYNLHSPLQPGVVKALLLVLRSSAALVLAAVAPLGVAQFIRMRTARSPQRGSQPVCNQPPADCKPHPACIHSNRPQTAAVKKKAATAAPFTHKPQGVACRGVQPRKCVHPPPPPMR